MKRLVLAASPALVVAAACRPPPPKDEFHLYNWNNYLAPETVKRFEESCKCTVVQTYYSDNEELLAKLAAGAKGYDMYVPTSNAVQALIKSGRLQARRQGAAPERQERRAGLPQHAVRSRATSSRCRTRCRRRSSATTTRR